MAEITDVILLPNSSAAAAVNSPVSLSFLWDESTVYEKATEESFEESQNCQAGSRSNNKAMREILIRLSPRDNICVKNKSWTTATMATVLQINI